MSTLRIRFLTWLAHSVRRLSNNLAYLIDPPTTRTMTVGRSGDFKTIAEASDYICNLDLVRSNEKITLQLLNDDPLCMLLTNENKESVSILRRL